MKLCIKCFLLAGLGLLFATGTTPRQKPADEW